MTFHHRLFGGCQSRRCGIEPASPQARFQIIEYVAGLFFTGRKHRPKPLSNATRNPSSAPFATDALRDPTNYRDEPNCTLGNIIGWLNFRTRDERQCCLAGVPAIRFAVRHKTFGKIICFTTDLLRWWHYRYICRSVGQDQRFPRLQKSRKNRSIATVMQVNDFKKFPSVQQLVGKIEQLERR